MQEKISQLIDQELNPAQRDALLERLINNDANNDAGNDDAARKSWKCYHLIGNVMRDEVSSMGKDLSARVRDKLEQEPTVLVPLRIKKPVSNERKNARKDVWQSVGLFAIAASLIVVAVVTLAPVTFDGRAHQLTASRTASNSSQALQFSHEFDQMLVDHAEFTASPGMNGLIAYAKLVSAEQLQQR
ncbi:sigma-E factor negative regulatory protein [Candidatus Spongiihabitans sp.]|uniref:sigma-E factor negative regulatory protein n=1 Tax=Candidatus Spongiihabitans sp. TaxID=3101308 RepID=UPI003C79DA1D